MNTFSSYLTRRGYVVRKADLTPKQLERIKKDLTVSPKFMGAPSFVKPKTFIASMETYTMINFLSNML